jgi:osmoprotectant transport system permease protein
MPRPATLAARAAAAPSRIPREATAAALLAALAALAPFGLGWISVAPNRLVSPRPAALPLDLEVSLAVGTYLLACLALLLLARRERLLPWAELAGACAVVALFATIGLGADAALDGGTRLARAMPAAGGWVAVLLLTLAAGSCAAGRGGTPSRFLVLSVLGLAVLALTGTLDGLSLLREAASRGPELRAAFAGHLLLAGGSLLLALLLAVPAGLLALARPRLEAAVMGLANGLQVVPSIALFGLLMGPLAALAAWLPGLRSLGIGGIGPAPAILGIAAYLLLPLASALLAGLRVASPALLDAAQGQGLSSAQVLRLVRLPLGLGVILGGLRLAAVQAVGLATLAALIGGGGLGMLVFQGIGQLAADLILLGVLPVIGLSLLVDAVLAAAQRGLARQGGTAR